MKKTSNLKAADFLSKTVTAKIDRPLGSRHPRHGFFYPINYGFIPDTCSPDGEEIDVYVLGVFDPIKEFTGKCIAVIERIDDRDDKVVLTAEANYSDEQIMALTEFQERFFDIRIVR